MVNDTLVINYYTDILCVWAWIAQKRIEEIASSFGSKVELRHYCVDVFGNTAQKMQQQWAQRGGYDGFAEHVLTSAAEFDDAILNKDAWTSVRPKTSANAHLVLKAAEQVEGRVATESLALSIRKAFFVEARDIGDLHVLIDLTAQLDMDSAAIEIALHNGSAMASLMADYQHARQQGIKGSPSWVLDNGRQTLYGNVGYRVLHANIEELLRHPSNEASWC